ncbi:MAG: glycosyltransferase family 4 protein [Anaerolineae bacterium]|nr:glycosyltransferase family 4 protein [Anaerolineae bacterium]
MRVLHITGTFAAGGIATSLWHLIRYLQQTSGIENEIAGLYEIGVFGERLAAAGVPAHNFELKTKYDPRGLSQLSALLRSGSFDVVHAQGWPAIWYVALVSLWHTQQRYFVSEQSVTNRRRRWYLKPLERFLFSRYGNIVAVSKAVRDALVSFLPETSSKITVVYNSADLRALEAAKQPKAFARAYLNIPDDALVILSGGGLEHKKGVDVSIRAMARLQNTNPALAPLLLIASDGSRRAFLEQLAAQLGVRSRVRFIGFRDDMPRVMSAADVLVSSSRWEGFGMVILEAMSLGLPVVATAVGGVPELIENQESGLLVPSEDPEALADGLARVLTNPEWAARLACVAQQRAEGFTPQTQVPLLVQLYQASDHV